MWCAVDYQHWGHVAAHPDSLRIATHAPTTVSDFRKMMVVVCTITHGFPYVFKNYNKSATSLQESRSKQHVWQYTHPKSVHSTLVLQHTMHTIPSMTQLQATCTNHNSTAYYNKINHHKSTSHHNKTTARLCFSAHATTRLTDKHPCLKMHVPLFHHERCCSHSIACCRMSSLWNSLTKACHMSLTNRKVLSGDCVAKGRARLCTFFFFFYMVNTQPSICTTYPSTYTSTYPNTYTSTYPNMYTTTSPPPTTPWQPSTTA